MRILPLPLLFVVLSVSWTFTACTPLPFWPRSQPAALNVTSTPKATVFLNGEHIGATPFYDEKIDEGEYSIKLTPESGVSSPWEARVKLSAGITTVISRELGEEVDQSSGYVLSLEPLRGSDAQTSFLLITSPDGALVSVDEEPKGFAPTSLEDLTTGGHLVVVSSPGYVEKSINAQIQDGYKLTANVQLAKALQIEQPKKLENKKTKAQTSNKEEEVPALDQDLELDSKAEEADAAEEDEDTQTTKEPTGEPIGQDLEPPYVVVLDTPTGWLNVRKTPTTAEDNVVTQVDPEDRYRYLDRNDGGWFLFELDTGEHVWASGKYLKLVEE